MELLRFTVRNQRLSGGKTRLVSDTIDYIEAFFDFRTNDWEGLSKWAHFTKEDKVFDVNLFEDRITKEMHLNLEAGTWEVKLHGTDPEGRMRVTTDSVYVYVDSYGEIGLGEPLPEIPVSVSEQIDAKSQLALDTANRVVKMAEEGEFDPVVGVDYWTEEDKEKILSDAVGLVKKGNKGDTGVGIERIETERTAEDGGMNHLNIILTNGEEYAWGIQNGRKGSDGKTGAPGLVWQGEWNEETSYSAIKDGQISRDVVSYNGSSYVVAVNSTAPVKGVVPEGDTTGKWALLVKKGFGVDEGDYSERLSEVEKEIEDLKYVPISVSSFGHDAGAKENGDKVSCVVLSWELNKEPVSLTVAGQAVTPEKSGFVTVNEDISETKTFDLVAADEREATAAKSVTLYFYDGVYYGTAAKPETVDSAFIKALSGKKLTGNKNQTAEIDGGKGLYFFYAYPKTMGTSKFNIGGFDYEYEAETVSFENDFGIIKDYYVYVSGQPISSDVSVTVKGG